MMLAPFARHVPVLLGPVLRAVEPVAGTWIDGTSDGVVLRAMGWVRNAASVPDQNSATCASARRTLRTTRGVIERMISVFWRSSRLLANRRPSTGRSPRPGTLAALERSSSRMRPISIWVSPSARRSTVLALRVPMS